jgi:hypothetical protein
VPGLVFSEGVFHHDGWRPGVLDPLPENLLAFLGGLYAEVSPHGADHWPDVWARLDAEHHRAPALSTDDLVAIATPSLLMFADGETEVEIEHVHAMHRAMPGAQLAVLPGTGTRCPPTNRSCSPGSSGISWLIEERREFGGECLRLLGELAPGDAGDAVAGEEERAVAGAILLEGAARAVGGEAVELDDEALLRPRRSRPPCPRPRG